MKQLFSLCFFSLTILYVHAQSNGDFRSKQSGSWNNPSTWEVFNAGTLSWDPATTFPASDQSVWIQDGDLVTLGQDAACENLHLNAQIDAADSSRLKTGAFILSIYGKLRTYSGSKGAIPGTNSTGLNNSKTFVMGTLKLAGGSHTATYAGEWGVPLNFFCWTLLVELNNNTDTVIIKTNLRAGSIIIGRGCLLMDPMAGGALRPDSGMAGTGNLVVGQEGTLIMNSTQISRTPTERFGNFTLENGGKLILPAGSTNTNIVCSNPKLSGTVISYNGKIPGNVSIPGSKPLDIFTNLRLESNVTLSRSIDVNGVLTLPDNGRLNLNGFLMNYGPDAVLEYAGTTAQTTSDAELPSSGPAPYVVINNAAGVNLHASRTLKNLVMVDGPLNVSSFTLSYEAGGTLTYAGTLNTTSDNEFPVADGPENLYVRNKGLSLHADRTLNGTLHLDSCRLMANPATITMGPSGNIVTEGPEAFVDGFLGHTINSTTATVKEYPVGMGDECRPMKLNIMQDASTPTVYIAHYALTTAYSPSTFISIDSFYTSRVWHVQKSSGANIVQASVSLSYTNMDGISDSSRLRISQLAAGSTEWSDLGGSGTVGQITSDSNFTSTGTFMLARGKVNLPTSVATFSPAESSSLKVYPNPATNELNLEILNTKTYGNEDIIFNLTDVGGKVVKTVSINGSEKMVAKVDVSDLQPGFYFCRMISGYKTEITKLLICR